MKRSSYMDRAMKRNDPRFASILSRLGYEPKERISVPEVKPARDRAVKVAEPEETVVEAEAEEEPAPKATKRTRAKAAASPRTYRRRDMTAEK